MKRLLPPFLFYLCVFMMILAAFLPWGIFILFPANLTGLIPSVLGVFLSIWGSRQFAKRKTNIMTFDRPNIMVTDGLFRYSRNPMYLGFLITLLGIWILLGKLIPGIFVLLFFLTAQFWYIPFEEKMMKKEFGTAYDIYRQKVRKWF